MRRAPPGAARIAQLRRQMRLRRWTRRLREVVARALAKNPDERWPNCRQFAENVKVGDELAPTMAATAAAV